jgi:hypothetical protein
MLEVGVAVRLNRLPSEVRAAPWEDVLLVAAYCQLEHEALKGAQPAAAPPAPAPRGPGPRTLTTTQKFVARKATKKEP